MFTNIAVTVTTGPAGQMIVTGELAAGYRESERLFRLCHANIAALPRLLDLPPAMIEEQVVTGRRGRLVLELPPSHTIGARLRRGMRTVFALGDVVRSVARQQAELDGSLAALRASRHELRQLIERLPEGVLVHRGGTVVWANAAVIESLGYEHRDEVVGRHILDFVPPEDRAPLAEEMAKAGPNQVNEERIEYRVLRPDGTYRRLQAGTVQHVEFEGARARLVVLRDVTEQHRLHDQLALAERMALIGRLGAGVAHEINNPLAYAHASIEVAMNLLAEQPRNDKLDEALARAREGTERVRGIVRDLKMLSRADDEPGEAVDLPALLDSTLALAANAIVPKARVIRSYGEAPRARATRGRLGQLFLNLLLNAADAIPDGHPERHEIRVRIGQDAAGRPVVEIADTGIGIPPALAERVFEPFFTTKPAGMGTGLGLAVCHRIVTQLGGEIELASTPDATTFRVALPPGEVESVPATEPRAVVAARADARGRRRAGAAPRDRRSDRRGPRGRDRVERPAGARPARAGPPLRRHPRGSDDGGCHGHGSVRRDPRRRSGARAAVRVHDRRRVHRAWPPAAREGPQPLHREAVRWRRAVARGRRAGRLAVSVTPAWRCAARASPSRRTARPRRSRAAVG